MEYVWALFDYWDAVIRKDIAYSNSMQTLVCTDKHSVAVRCVSNHTISIAVCFCLKYNEKLSVCTNTYTVLIDKQSHNQMHTRFDINTQTYAHECNNSSSGGGSMENEANIKK